jgi:hypothetical protein
VEFLEHALDALDAFEYLTAMSVEVKPRGEAPAREDWPKDYISVPAAAGHWLTQDVHEIATRSESLTDAWNLTVNPRMPAYVLATTPTTNADALLLSSVGAGALVICTYGSLLENSMLGERDNRSLVVNLLRHHLASGGRVIFDDGHQGLHTIYDAQAFLTTRACGAASGCSWPSGCCTRSCGEPARSAGRCGRARAPDRTSYACWRHFRAQGLATGRRPAPDRKLSRAGCPSHRQRVMRRMQRSGVASPYRGASTLC